MASFLLLLGILGFFFSSPQGAGPDESWHQATAWHLVENGQIEKVNRTVVNEIPASIAKDPCFAFNKQATADCISERRNEVGLNREFKVFNYPPVSYMFVGIGQKISQSLSKGNEDLGGRIGSIAINYLLLILALRILTFQKSNKETVILAVVNPIFLFLIAVANPSSLEITGCILYAVAFWRYIVDKNIEKKHLYFLGLSSLSLMVSLTRPIGVVWTILISIICVIFFSSSSYHHSKLAGGILIPSLIGVFFWNKIWETGYEVLPGNLPITNPSFSNYFEWFKKSVLSSGELLQTSIGKLGWLDTPVPMPILIVYIIFYMWFVILMLQGSAMRRQIEFILLIVFSIPIFGNFYFWNAWPNYWQGRYSLPIIIPTLMLVFLKICEGRKNILLNNLGSLNLALISIMIVVNIIRYKLGIPTNLADFDLQKLLKLNLSSYFSLLTAITIMFFAIKYMKIGFRIEEIKI